MLSVNSELITQKDHTAALASRDMGDDSDTVYIPPVPPLPQVYQSPSTAKFNVQHLSPHVATLSQSVPPDKERDLGQVRLGPASRPGPQPPGVQLRWRMIHRGIIVEIQAKGRKFP